MKSFVVFGSQEPLSVVSGSMTGFPVVEIDQMQVRSGIVELDDPAVDLSQPWHACDVLVEVKAFSCNYRDKAFISRIQQFPASRYAAVGSEFVAKVLAVGAGVTSLKPGDRVIPNHHYLSGSFNTRGIPEGIPTNRAARQYHCFHESKLLRLPDGVPDTVAAAFSLGAQTAYSMVRKMAPRSGMNVLVTSATSSTSLFLISALKRKGVHIFATTTSSQFDSRLQDLGVEQVLHVGRDDGFSESEVVVHLAGAIGLFDQVFDPFFDLHLERSLEVLAPFGKYSTCGLLHQQVESGDKGMGLSMNAERIMISLMAKNLLIMGNCLGVTEDLERALADYTTGQLDVIIDSVFEGGETGAFLSRTFSDQGRFGKVVFRF
jgi:NADPH:quinone reductase-like Zn-dependent oxidoreductase